MFGLGKKSAKKKAGRGKAAAKRAPLRYLGPLGMMTYARTKLDDVRDMGWIAYPIIALVAWRTYQSERRRQAKAQDVADRAAIRRTAQQTLLPDKPKKRFLFF